METITLRMPEDLSMYLTNLAKRKGITRNALIIQIFWEWKRQTLNEENKRR